MSTEESTKTEKKEHLRAFLLVFLALCIIGIGLSVELTRVHYYTHTNPSYQSVCQVSEKINCRTVAQSPYSVFAGIPVSVWGILGYALMGVLALLGLSPWRLHGRWPLGGLAILTLVSTLLSFALAYVSITRIDSLCLFCTGLYAVNFIQLCLMVGAVIKSGRNPASLVAEDVRALLFKPLQLALLVGVPVATVAALLAFVDPYWQHPGWQEIPELPTGIDEKGRHWIGAKDAKVTIVEFSDYECPHCRRAHKEMRMLASKYPNEVRFIHSHLPLDHACNKTVKGPYHLRACEFSKAVECAGEQGKFWGMNDAVFKAQERTRAAGVDIEALAVRLGLDRSEFADCMDQTGVPERIREDMKVSRRLKVPGTPTYYINSRPFPGGIPPKALENAVKSARKKSK